MNAGVVGDIHQDLAALRATLAGPLADCQRLITTGDFLDRGPDTAGDTLNHLLDARVELVAGNHELAYLGGPVYANMLESGGMALRDTLRTMVIDGDLVAARTAGDVLLVHGGVSLSFWREYLAPACGTDVAAMARALNRWLSAAVLRNDWSHPAFNALEADVRGPFWAHLEDDLLSGLLPPFRQAVGHTKVHSDSWIEQGDGAVFPLERVHRSADSTLGHVVIIDS